jgi:hypothetical protein
MSAFNLENLDLSGLEHKWQKRGNKCAVCGKDYDNLTDEDYEKEELENEGCTVPLQIFRGKGKNCEMLTLCVGCARILSQRKECN